jgi:hypothetical protein
MKLEIREVKDRGETNERLVLVALEDCDIGKYFVFVSKKNNNNIIFTQIFHPYWFPDKLIKKNDLIILYTKKGENSLKTNTDGTTSYFYYRGVASPIYTNNFFALVVEANTWKIEKTKPI